MSYSMNRPVVDGSVPLDRYELTFAVANTDHGPGIAMGSRLRGSNTESADQVAAES